MDLWYIIRADLLVLKNRLKKYKAIQKVSFTLVLIAIFVGLFILNYKIFDLINLDRSIYTIVLISIISILILLTLSHTIKQTYKKNFELSNNSILLTAPLDINSIFFYKYIKIQNVFFIPFFILVLPTIVSFNLISKVRVGHFIISIFSLILLCNLVCAVIQLIVMLLSYLIKERHRKVVINFIASSISLFLFAIILFILDFNEIGEVFKFIEGSKIIHSIFFPFVLFNNILGDIYKGSSYTFSLVVLIISTLFILIVYNLIYRHLLSNGIFLTAGSKNKKVKNKGLLYNVLKKVYKSRYFYIYKDLIIFIRNPIKYELIITPILLMTVVFFSYKASGEEQSALVFLMISVLWICNNIAMDSIKSESKMLRTIKNSTFNIELIIKSKIDFAFIISILVYAVLSIVILFITKENLLRCMRYSIATIGIMVLAISIFICFYLMYSKEEEDKIEIKPSGEVKAYGVIILIIAPIVGIIYWLEKYLEVENIGIMFNLALIIMFAVIVTIFTLIVSKKIVGIVCKKNFNEME